VSEAEPLGGHLMFFHGGTQTCVSEAIFQCLVKDPDNGYSSKLLQSSFRTGFIQMYQDTASGEFFARRM
jgi:hypothetical protein